jgi:hypothetical protein
MHNELVQYKSYWQRNWKLVLSGLLFLIISGYFLFSSFSADGMDLVQAYAEKGLYEKTLEKEKENNEVKHAVGELEPLDPLAILEGSTKYDNHKNSIETTVRIKGTRGKAKMHIWAIKNGGEWQYTKVDVRINSSKKRISIIK